MVNVIDIINENSAYRKCTLKYLLELIIAITLNFTRNVKKKTQKTIKFFQNVDQNSLAKSPNIV